MTSREPTSDIGIGVGIGNGLPQRTGIILIVHQKTPPAPRDLPRIVFDGVADSQLTVAGDSTTDESEREP